MTPLERAARALCLADGLDPDRKFKSSDWSEGTAPHEFAWHEYLPKARAVLTAIREPNEAMERAMIGITGDMAIMKRDGSSYRHADVYRAMIDAALAEG
jgi:hypothetical protein